MGSDPPSLRYPLKKRLIISKSSEAMPWTPLSFGKHKDKTLPQIVFADPDWFFWAFDEGVFEKHEKLREEAAEVKRKATSIRIPQSGTEKLVAEYGIDPRSDRYCHIELVPQSRQAHSGTTRTMRLDVFDLSVPRQHANYDKKGYQMIISSIKYYLFGDKKHKMTKKRCEIFFDNNSNFEL